MGGVTSKLLLRDHLDAILEVDADLYVVAVGTNDVRYREPDICAMDDIEYIACLQQLRDEIVDTRPGSNFIFVAPWTSTDEDQRSALAYPDKVAMNQLYSDALQAWCANNGDLYVNPNPYIEQAFAADGPQSYLIDAIHPNPTTGVQLYSEAFLLG